MRAGRECCRAISKPRAAPSMAWHVHVAVRCVFFVCHAVGQQSVSARGPAPERACCDCGLEVWRRGTSRGMRVPGRRRRKRRAKRHAALRGGGVGQSEHGGSIE